MAAVSAPVDPSCAYFVNVGKCRNCSLKGTFVMAALLCMKMLHIFDFFLGGSPIVFSNFVQAGPTLSSLGIPYTIHK